MNPIIRALFIISFTVMIIPDLQQWHCLLQESMLRLLRLLHMHSICHHIFLQGLGFGMNAFNPILLLLLLQNAMLKLRELKDIGMKNCMAWTILFMLTCKKEKTILQKNNWIILKPLEKFTR